MRALIIIMTLFSFIGATDKVKAMDEMKLKKATLGGGCFWCVEAVFEEVKGIQSVTSGFMGGKVKNPSYREVVSGLTGHAEVIQLEYNPEVITYAEILEIFWMTHDPTTLNRQGADVGTQYRSVIFYHDENQKEVAEGLMKRLEEADVYPDPIVTEISAASAFYIADDYHQDYYSLNGQAPYCQYVIRPKMEKFREVFSKYLKASIK